ncbi:MAG: hypothetical protein L0K42_11960 [Acidipropionibacterium jensenii]|uniref:hypothetical protein n=1 Tax=Acidipropionibacterium jensenii TaxID=1749 RepID=UPI002649B81E|nr:hypothetical protein [Acidipropionibacterium jensenii]MDN6481399.1 hypothetical protein [Acidipropionibacterium jensenii]MDN6762952.1 hypothetical protein [Acidipropionibacterium jensenii]
MISEKTLGDQGRHRRPGNRQYPDPARSRHEHRRTVHTTLHHQNHRSHQAGQTQQMKHQAQ